MSKSTLRESSTGDRKNDKDKVNTDEDLQDDKVLERKVKKVRREIEKYNHEVYNVLGAASRSQYEGLQSWLNSVTATEQDLEYLEEFRKLTPRLLESAHSVHDKFHRDLAAAQPDVISSAMAGIWIDRFLKADFKEAESYVQGGKLSRWLEKAKELNKEREQLLKNPEVKKISNAAVPNISKLLSDSSFKSMSSNKEKAALISEVRAALSVTGSVSLEPLFKEARNRLKKAAEDGVLSEKKISGLMGRFFEGSPKPEEVAAFLDPKNGRLREIIKEWSRLRGQFDAVEGRRKKEGTPRSFHFVKVKAFLDWHRPQQLSYIEMANDSFDVSKENPLLLDIQREIASQDWDTAEYLIGKTVGMQLNEEERRRIASMKNYIRQHNTKGAQKVVESSPDKLAEKTLLEMRTAIAHIPSSLQGTYIRAIQKGPGVLAALCSTMYNRVWWKTNTDMSEQEIIQKYTQPTEESASKKESDWKPVSQDAESALGEMEAHQSDSTYKYYKTLIPKGVSYESHAQVVKSINPILKSGVRTLASLGVSFTAVGPPITLKYKKQGSANAEYTLAA